MAIFNGFGQEIRLKTLEVKIQQKSKGSLQERLYYFCRILHITHDFLGSPL